MRSISGQVCRVRSHMQLCGVGRQKLNLKVKMVWSKYALVLTQVPLKILQISYVPFTQVLPVHPAEQLHVSGETQDPRQLSHPWEQIAVK